MKWMWAIVALLGATPVTAQLIDSTARGLAIQAKTIAAQPSPKISRAVSVAVTSNPYDLPELGSVTTSPTGSQVQITFPSSCSGKNYVAASGGTAYVGTDTDSDWANFYAKPVIYGGAGTHMQFQSGTLPSGTSGSNGANIFLTTGGTPVLQPLRATLAAVEMNTDAASLCIKVLKGGGSPYFRLLVGSSPQNLQYVTKATPDPVNGSTTIPNSGYIQLTFSTVAIRTVRFESELDIAFNGVFVPAGYSVWQTNPKTLVRCAILGDSYSTTNPPVNTGTTASNNVTSVNTVVWNGPVVQASRMLGCNDIRNAGIAGTGFVNPGATWNFGSHVIDVTTVNPDIYINTGAFNDNTTYTNAQISAAVTSVLKAQRASSPNATIIQFGSWAGNTGPSTAVIQSEIAVKSAVMAMNDPNICFVPISDRVGNNGVPGSAAIMSGTGSDIAPKNDGNNDLYLNGNQTPPTHPNLAGSNYIARRLVVAMRSCLATR